MKLPAYKGFTLIELLIVIAVIGVLSVGVLTALNVTSQLGKANLSKAKTFSASVENALAINQVGKWSFEDPTSLDKDTSGYGNSGSVTAVTQQNAATCGLGFGACASFNGTTSYVSINDSSSLKPTSGITVSAWVKPINFTCFGGEPECAVISKYNSSKGFQFLVNSLGVPSFTIVSGPIFFQAASSVAIKSGEWSYIVGTWSSSSTAPRMKIYVNGNQTGTADGSEISYDGTPASIGKASWFSGDFFNGLIDEVAIYNQALLSSQVQQLYAQGLPRHQLAKK